MPLKLFKNVTSGLELCSFNLSSFVDNFLCEPILRVFSYKRWTLLFTVYVLYCSVANLLWKKPSYILLQKNMGALNSIMGIFIVTVSFQASVCSLYYYIWSLFQSYTKFWWKFQSEASSYQMHLNFYLKPFLNIEIIDNI